MYLSGKENFFKKILKTMDKTTRPIVLYIEREIWGYKL